MHIRMYIGVLMIRTLRLEEWERIMSISYLFFFLRDLSR